jgi:hypothetical protein
MTGLRSALAAAVLVLTLTGSFAQAALAPDAVGVLIPRGAVLLSAAKQMPDGARAREYVRVAVGDFEKSLKLQQSRFATLSVHAKGELLGGLAEGWSRLGETEKARAYLTQLVSELPESKYAAAAKARLENTGGPERGDVPGLSP